MIKGTTAPCRVAFGSLKTAEENLSKKMEWHVSCEMTLEDFAPIEDHINQEMEEKIKIGKFPKEKRGKLYMPFKPATMKDPDGGDQRVAKDGFVLVAFKRKQLINVRGQSKMQAPPTIWDGSGLNITNLPNCPEPGNGSIVIVRYAPYAYDNVQVGVQLQLIGVQIVELKEHQEDAMAPVEGAYRVQETQDSISSLLDSETEACGIAVPD